MADNLRTEIARSEHRQRLIDFLVAYFRVDEPITRSVRLNEDDAREFFGDLVDEGLDKPISFVVLNEKDEIVACRLNEIVDIDQSNSKSTDTSSQQQHHSATVAKILGFLELVTKNTESLLDPGTKRIMKFVAVSVRPDYQRRGIAKDLIDRSMRLAKERGCDYVCTGATARRSQELFEKKLGFHTLRTVGHDEYLDAEKKPIIQCDDGTVCGKLMAKKL